MEATRIVKTINSDRLPELNAYKGQNVEIIILPIVSEFSNQREKINSILDLRGKLKSKIDGLTFQNKFRKEWNEE